MNQMTYNVCKSLENYETRTNKKLDFTGIVQ